MDRYRRGRPIGEHALEPGRAGPLRQDRDDARPGDHLTAGDVIAGTGLVGGYIVDANSTYRGFLRWPTGKVTRIDVPGAGTGLGHGTIVYAVNGAGDALGVYIDANNISHGFIRTR